jgi:hypothetical protein
VSVKHGRGDHGRARPAGQATAAAAANHSARPGPVAGT